MITFNDKELKRFEGDLKTFASRAYPFATKQTVNRAAFVARSLTQRNIRRDMVTRNRFTEGSIRVEPTRTLVVRQQEAVVGSIAPYMEDQEFGGTKVSTGKEGVAIQTSYSAGQRGQRPRTRMPRRVNALKNIQLQRRRARGGSRKSRNAGLIKHAAVSGSKYVFLDLGRTKGIFRVVGGKRKPRIRMVADLSRRSVVIPPTPTLGPAVRETQKAMPLIYKRALVSQLKRHRLFLP